MFDFSREDLLETAVRIAPGVHRTPVLTSRSLDRRFRRQIFCKCENFQRGGAFKIRGATNAVAAIVDEAVGRGVATHSSGNHGAALALAADAAGLSCHVVMPHHSVRSKVEAVRAYGADVTFCDPTMAGRRDTLDAIVAETGAVVVHPYNDERVIAGQATATAELLEEVPQLDAVIVPIGGGGLAAGAVLAARHMAPQVQVITAEPEGADDAMRSMASGRLEPVGTPQTIADGLRASLGDKPFAVLRRGSAVVVTVSEPAIVEAMRLVWQRMKIVIEPSAAVPLAALLEQRVDASRKRVGVVLSGGNVDLDALPW